MQAKALLKSQLQVLRQEEGVQIPLIFLFSRSVAAIYGSLLKMVARGAMASLRIFNRDRQTITKL
ncbi:hypothetical protein NMG60_11013409 [Bertholletia excelsa]